MRILFLFCFTLLTTLTSAQEVFDFSLQLSPKKIPNFPGLHSYAYAQHKGKWLIIGGRRDGIHARQPFNAFPQSDNNTDIYVVDINSNQFWTASVSSLSIDLREQLQSTNTNYYQDDKSLYIIGGYGYSSKHEDHITFPFLISIDVPKLINLIVSGSKTIDSCFNQINNPIFAITGGQLGKINDSFYLVGGHRFDGRYNPVGNPTFTQTYSNAIQKFKINNKGKQLVISEYESIVDPINLRRRDFNLLPQIFPNKEIGYTLSSGVFQINTDSPFYFPVDITKKGYIPLTGFNQYLSNYQSAKACFYDNKKNKMYNIFFGGISQHYFENRKLVEDDQVPFVKTISCLMRNSDGSMKEYLLPIEMPFLHGAAAEFIPNLKLPRFRNGVLKLDEIKPNEVVIGHILGGIKSSERNPFSNNENELTSSESTIYEVKLVRNSTMKVKAIEGNNPFEIFIASEISNENSVKIEYDIPYIGMLDYFVSTTDGIIIKDGEIQGVKIGKNSMNFKLENVDMKTIIITFIFDNKFYSSKKIILD